MRARDVPRANGPFLTAMSTNEVNMASTNASTRARASRATSRGTVRDSARQCGTVFEDGKGRSSSRRAGKKMRALTCEFHIYFSIADSSRPVS